MKIQTILFDLDNTLVRCMVYYEFIRKNMYITLSRESGIPVAEISTIFDTVERARVSKPSGFTKQAFLDSINESRVEIYNRLKKNDIVKANYFYESDISFKLLNFASSVYDAPYTMYEDVYKSLISIKNMGISMYVVTKGSFYSQARKASIFGEIFDGLYVLPRKDVDTWCGVVESMQLDRSCTLVVGDSINDDINPAIQNGLEAIVINRHSTDWVGDPKTPPLKTVKMISTLNELVEIIEEA